MALYFMASTSYKWPDGFFDQAEKDLSVEKHPTESHKEKGIGDQVGPPSFVVETPFHQATTERPAGLICVEKIGLARRRLLPTCPAVPQWVRIER